MTAGTPAAETTETGAAPAAPASAPPTPNVQISVFGRLVADPVDRVSKGGTNYTTARVAVNVTGPRAAEPQTWFINVTAFRDAAARLAKSRKGSGVCLMGDLTKSTHDHFLDEIHTTPHDRRAQAMNPAIRCCGISRARRCRSCR